jgi:multidrug resistance efflux pump
VAPIDGQIIKSSVVEGQVVGTSQTLAVIANINDLYISANIEESDISQIKVGQTVDITIDSLPGQKIQGKVSEIGQATASTFSVISSQSSSGSYTKVTQLVPIKIRFPVISGAQLLPGISAEIKIHVGE